MRALLLLAASIVLATPAHAADLVVALTDPRGRPVTNAVVTLYPAGRPAPLSAARQRYRIEQRDLRFKPFVLVVPAGSEVSFPNFDNVLHHVYSFSRAKRFELKLYAREQSRFVRFDTAGAVPIGCNIHDNMTAFIKVVDTSLNAKSDGSGRVVMTDVPTGPLIARVWHPYLRTRGNQLEFRWTARPGRQAQKVILNLRSPPTTRTTY